MNELKKKRKEIDITQHQAANACGVSLRTYQTYEETSNLNDTYNFLLNKLKEMGILDGSNYILSVNYIKKVCRDVISSKYTEIECLFLYGSYARGDANGKSDVNLLLLLSKPLGKRKTTLENKLNKLLKKKVTLKTFDELLENRKETKNVFKDGIRIYSK